MIVDCLLLVQSVCKRKLPWFQVVKVEPICVLGDSCGLLSHQSVTILQIYKLYLLCIFEQ
jgi:hypothetical protein